MRLTVGLRRLLLFCAVVVFPALVDAQVLETLTIPAGPVGAFAKTDHTLYSNTHYTIIVSGTFVWGGCDQPNCPNGGPDYLRWGDLGRLTDDHFATPTDPFWNSIIYVEFNGSPLVSSFYNPQHAYAFAVAGNDQQATFAIHDCDYCYADNAGSLRVEILQGTGGTLGHTFIANDQFQHPVQFQQHSMTTESFASPDHGNWGNTPYGNPATSTIGAKGCFLTDWAMIVDAWGAKYGFHTDPYQLNQWLQQNEGFEPDGLSVRSQKVVEYANKMTEAVRKVTSAKPLVYNPEPKAATYDNLNNLMNQGIPAILAVNGGGHYVLAVGKTISPAGIATWYINDPYFNPNPPNNDVFASYDLRPTLALYSNNFTRIQYATSGDSVKSLGISLGSPAELLVTDQLSRRTGVDATTGIDYNEIPNSSYEIDELDDDINQTPSPEPPKTFYVSTPIDGQYIVQVIGTGTGDFHLSTLAYDTQGDPSSNLTTGTIQGAGDTHTYLLSYSSSTGIAAPQIATTVLVKVKPGDPTSAINPTSTGTLPVAIFGSSPSLRPVSEPDNKRFRSAH